MLNNSSSLSPYPIGSLVRLIEEHNINKVVLFNFRYDDEAKKDIKLSRTTFFPPGRGVFLILGFTFSTTKKKERHDGPPTSEYKVLYKTKVYWVRQKDVVLLESPV